MFFKIFIFLLFFIKSSYAHELRPAIANLNIYEKNNITNATISIQLNLEAIIASVDIKHTNTENSKESDEYENLRNMSAVELIEKFNSKIKNERDISRPLRARTRWTPHPSLASRSWLWMRLARVSSNWLKRSSGP